ncbi:MAG: hypothetical protein LBF01_01945, partial [Bacteroidales bacterium]|nr:hypothetical protein [Bacteroidales bacterium]
KQQKSLQWVLNEYKNATWLDDDSLKRYFPMQIAGSSRVRSSLLSNVKGLFHNIILSSYYSASPYSIDDFSGDLYKATWSTLLRGTALAEGDIALQKEIVKMLCESFGKKYVSVGYTSSFSSTVLTTDDVSLTDASLVNDKPLLAKCADYDCVPSLADVEAYGLNGGWCHSAGDGVERQFDFGKTSPYLTQVNISAIDQTAAYLQDMAVRSRDLLKSRLNSVSAKDKIHYQSLLIQLNAALKDKM